MSDERTEHEYSHFHHHYEGTKRDGKEGNTREYTKKYCGVDVAYRDNIAYCSAVLMNKDSMKVKHSINLTLSVKHHYAPSFFMLRESEHFDIVKKPF